MKMRLGLRGTVREIRFVATFTGRMINAKHVKNEQKIALYVCVRVWTVIKAKLAMLTHYGQLISKANAAPKICYTL